MRFSDRIGIEYWTVVKFLAHDFVPGFSAQLYVGVAVGRTGTPMRSYVC